MAGRGEHQFEFFVMPKDGASVGVGITGLLKNGQLMALRQTGVLMLRGGWT